MKKSYIYLLILGFFVLASGFIVYKYKETEKAKEEAYLGLLPRKGAAANTSEWTETQNIASKLLEAIKANPKDTKANLELAALFIKEARVTGNHVYNYMEAMKYINNVLKTEPNNFNAQVFKSLIYISQHHFADGLAMAESAKNLNPYNAYIYGLIVDGNVEMGNYKQAVENADKMVSLRPDLMSYSRVSYLREIHGDLNGAIEAMKMAVEAGAPGDESAEWARVQLGHLYENIGELKYAEMHYTIALDQRPGYAYALAGMARIAMAQKDYNKAIKYYEQADSSVNDYSFKEDLVEAYRLAGQKEKANQTAQLVIDGMSKDAQKGNNDENIGHYADRELAYAYLKVNDYDKALEHALLEYNRRPENIDVNETVAWVYYNKGDFEKALPYIKVAQKTNSQNPTLLCRAGLIYAKAGDKTLAKNNFKNALKSNPNIDATLKNESEQIFKTL
jgi:tetratricopeptide (TPR) repeat protein